MSQTSTKLDLYSSVNMFEQCLHANQPVCIFMAFYICGGMVELCVFDRSSIYSGSIFDGSESPCRLLAVLIGNVLMSEAELGLRMLIKYDGLGKYILCRGDDKTNAEKLYLEDLPMFARQNKNIVSDGLTSYRARR